MLLSKIAAALLLGLIGFGACGGEQQAAPDDPTTTPTSDSSPSPAEAEPAPPSVTPADAVFSEELPGYAYERNREIEQLFESQFNLVFASAPPSLKLHSVAARRVLNGGGDVQGSVVAISVELGDGSLVPKFQEGLLSGLGEGVREVDIQGVPAFYKENFTENGQDVVVFFYEDTLAVEVFGVTRAAARGVAGALVNKLLK